MEWHLKRFAELTTIELYQLIKLRIDVFVVEQQCLYAELDNKDIAEETRHLWCTNADGIIVAYLRILPMGLSYTQVSFGRVAVINEARGQTLGKQLVFKAIEHCHFIWPKQSICIGAQKYLLLFYQDFGFKVISDTYLEDNIPHMDMLLEAN